MAVNYSTIRRVSTDSDGVQGNSGSFAAVFSADGSKVAFDSRANNRVLGDTNGTNDVFAKDLASGAIERGSTDATGAQANGISSVPVFSPDGGRVAFQSSAINLVPGDTNGRANIFVKDLTTGAIERVSTSATAG